MGIRNKRAQEEIVGFAVIVIIVSIIVVFFLVFSISNKGEQIDSYEAESFLQSALVYTSSCEERSQLLSIQDLIVACYDEQVCENGQDACLVLEQTLTGITEESWNVGSDFPVKGYKLEGFTGEEVVFSIESGNSTGIYKGAQQPIPKAGIQITVIFTAYY